MAWIEQGETAVVIWDGETSGITNPWVSDAYGSVSWVEDTGEIPLIHSGLLLVITYDS